MAVALLTIVALGLTAAGAAQQHERGHQHTGAHYRGVMERGAQRMGFDQQTTTHHFVLRPDGGFLRVQANSATDTASIAQIRAHLQEIWHKFSQGDFNAPEFIHAQEPPGVSVMQQHKAAIRYAYRPIERGAELRIAAKDPKIVSAIHDFLKFQITDHKTGDPLQVRR